MKALELDPELPEAHLSLAAYLLVNHRDLEGARREIESVLEASPNLPEIHHVYAFYLMTMGRCDEAVVESRRALEFDPKSVSYSRLLGLSLWFARRYDEAIVQYREALVLDPNDADMHECLGNALVRRGCTDEALAAWRRAITLRGDDEVAAVLQRTEPSGFDNAMRAVARARLARLTERAGRNEYVPAIEYARQYVRAGDDDLALQWLEKASAERNVFSLLMWHDPVYDPLREKARFADVLRSVQHVPNS